MSLDHVRSQFPQLQKKVNGYDFVYLDSAATTLKPRRMIDRLTQYYSEEVSNVHRGAHYFSDLATENYENTRSKVAQFLNCENSNIAFTSGTTESINLVVHGLHSLAQKSSRREIVLSSMEHHSNIIPWFLWAQKEGFKIKVIELNSKDLIDIDQALNLISDQTFIVALVHMSNVLGTLNPIEPIIRRAKEMGAYSLVDAAQSVSYKPICVKTLGCDFLAFSAHKLFGPEGVGVLYGDSDLWDQMDLYKSGGGVISHVSFDHVDFISGPQRFEAGTPAIGPVIAFAEALDFFKTLDYKDIQSHESHLMNMCYKGLKDIKGFQLLGDIELKKNILSFNFKDINPLDLGTLLDQRGIAVRTGPQCAHPLIKSFSLDSVLRASFSIYNQEQDVHHFIEGIKYCQEILSG